MIGYVILTGLWFWLAVIVIAGAVIYEVENRDSGFGATVATLGGAAALWFLTGGQNPLPWLADHLAIIIGFIVLYVAIGAVWGIFYWRVFFLNDKGDEYEARRTQLQAEWTGLSEGAQGRYGSYKGYVASKGYPPNWLEHKADYTMWLTWWWASMFWTFTGKTLKRVITWIMTSVSAMMIRMSHQVFADRFTELK